MIIGVPSEVKNNESRVGLTPQSVQKIVNSGHEVLIQKKAGANIGFFDDQYLAAGAKVKDTAEEVYKSSEMIVKVKEPIPEEYKFSFKQYDYEDLKLKILLSADKDLNIKIGKENKKYINQHLDEKALVKNFASFLDE